MTEAAELSAQRGAQAALELRETEQAFKDVRAGLLEVIASSAIGETELREKCFFAVQNLDAVKALLIAVAGGQAIAEHDDLIRNIISGKDAA